MAQKLRDIKHFALDLDGTLYLGGRLFDFTIPFLDALRRRGIGWTFFTNNSSKSTRQYVQHLRAMGIEAQPQEIYSSTHATLEYLREQLPSVRRVFLLGTPGLREEFAEQGYEFAGDGDDAPDAVVVGFDPSLTYLRVCRAAYWISQGKPFIATNCDRVCPTDQPTVLVDCGSICKMLSHATGREPDAVLGKPDPRMLHGVMRRHALRADELAVVGDRIYTDMAMARAAGATGILVLSGETTAEQAAAAQPAPDLIVNHVGELERLLAPRGESIPCEKV
jgi:HAD superfamily hydrolase (TIGR01450 family)